MKRISELGGSKPLAILDGRTLEENAEWYADRVRRGTNIGGPNYVPPRPRPDERPETDDGAEALRLHLARCGVPSRIAEVIQSGLRDTAPVTAVRQWWGVGKSFMLLHGDTGGGKSVAASAAFLRMKRVIAWDGGSQDVWDSNQCEFQEATELARFGYFDEEAKQVLDHLADVTCLVLDDLGTELMSESWRSTLEELLAYRHGRTGRRTLLTTNVSARRPDASTASPFEARYGARIARRIRESGSVVAVEAER